MPGMPAPRGEDTSGASELKERVCLCVCVGPEENRCFSTARPPSSVEEVAENKTQRGRPCRAEVLKPRRNFLITGACARGKCLVAAEELILSTAVQRRRDRGSHTQGNQGNGDKGGGSSELIR